MRGAHAVFTIVWSVLASVGGDSSKASTPTLPFQYLHACKTSLPTNNNNNDNDNDVANNTTTTTTVLLFHDPRALSSSSSSSSSTSSCSCKVTGPSNISLTRLGPTPGATNITVTYSNTTVLLGNVCQSSVDTGVLECGGFAVSQDQPLTISLTTVGEGEGDNELTLKTTPGGSRGRKKGGGGYVLLAVQGQGAVSIECREPNATSTDQPASPSTAPKENDNDTTIITTTTTTTPSLSSSSSNSSTAGSQGGDNSSSATIITTTTTTTTSGGGGGGGDDNNKKQTTTGGGGVGPADADGGSTKRLGARDQDRDNDAQANLPEFLVLGLGVALSVVAGVVIVVVIVKHRRSKRKNSTDLESPPPAEPNRGRKNRTSNSSNNNNKNSNNNSGGGGGGKGKGKSGKAGAAAAAAAEGSRDSLLNENHNYEEVSDDGLGEVGLHVNRDRKISNISLPPAPYSHIKAAAAATTTTTSPYSTSSQFRRNTTPALTEASDNEDYNHLDLAHSARRFNPGAAAASSLAARTFYVSEDDEYSDVNDLGPGGGGGGRNVDDDAGSDIYEAVDGDPDRTPLCPRKQGEKKSRGKDSPRPEYTDCVSSEDGKFHIAGARDSKTLPGKTPTRLSNFQSSNGKEEKNPPPHLPTSPPPQAGRGLHRSNSRSMDQLVRERFQQRKSHQQQQQQQQQQHRHSKSLDLNLCQQRDLFLRSFRTQGDGAARADVQPPGVEEDDLYANMPASAAAHRSNLASPSSQQQQQQQQQQHDPTTPTTTQPHPNPEATSSPQATNAATTTTSSPHPQATTSQEDSDLPSPGAEPVMLRRKSRSSSKKKGGGGGGVEGRRTMVDHLKELNTGLLELETAVRHSMEIKDDELVMMDNIIYGTLPRNLSLPTTEL